MSARSLAHVAIIFLGSGIATSVGAKPELEARA